MAQSIEESLFEAIKNDDKKAFIALTEKARRGEYRLGRFPVLSLLYLYKSRKILSEYEEKFLKVTDYEQLREPAEISKKFSVKAGKCLRLYFSETVSPLEMLLILDRTRRLKRVYPSAKPSPAVKARLKTIYSIKYSLNVKFEGENLILDRRPLSYREKKNIAAVCLCSVLAVTLAVGVPVTTVALLPEPVAGEVTKLSQINFASQEEYTLKRDLVLPDNYYVEKVNCRIIGEGNKIIFGNGASLGELNGKISGLTIESSGGALFNCVSENAVIENVTVNVSASVSSTVGTAFVAGTNYGTFDGVTVNVSGNLNALATSAETVTELNFGGLVQNNNYKYDAATKTVYRGTVKNCTVNYTQFVLVGEVGANASFGGLVGINNGYVQDGTVTGEIIADTFDLAGVCVLNNVLLSGNLNEAELSQNSSQKDWNPIVCGIVLSNANTVENCVNRGSVSALSDCGQTDESEQNEPTASASGIAYLSRGTTTSPYIKNCANYGAVACSALNRNAYGAGICVSTSGGIENCSNSGAVSVSAENGRGTYAGGIACIAYGYVFKSVNRGAVSSACEGDAYIGGISAHSCSQFSNCLSGGEITVTAKTVCAGGIFGYSEVARFGFSIYGGTAEYCISECKINVTATDEEPSYIGGIAGYVREAGFNSIDSVIYFGGGVTNCYFTGECITEASYFGNIAGVCGINIYESNFDMSDNNGTHNFDGNYYINNSFSAFGAAVTVDGEYSEVEDKGATSARLEEIQSIETYKEILSAFED